MNEEVKTNETHLCRRCGRKLKSPESIALGFGVTCYKKFMARAKLRPLFVVKSKKIVNN